ncbi:RNA polymerase, sigma-24 subunit, ECF subfamily, partial [sediment metagenome]
MTLLETVLNIVKKEYESRGKLDIFDALHESIAGNSGGASSYAELAGRLKTTEGNLKIMVYRLRRQFGETLR